MIWPGTQTCPRLRTAVRVSNKPNGHQSQVVYWPCAKPRYVWTDISNSMVSHMKIIHMIAKVDQNLIPFWSNGGQNEIKVLSPLHHLDFFYVGYCVIFNMCALCKPISYCRHSSVTIWYKTCTYIEMIIKIKKLEIMQ